MRDYKIKFLCLFLMAIFFYPSILLAGKEISKASIDDLKKHLVQGDIESRRQFAKKIFDSDLAKQDSEFALEYISIALSSDDPIIKNYGASGARYISFLYSPRILRDRGQKTPYDLKSKPSILKGLVSTFGTELSDAKASAIFSLILSYDPIAELKPVLLKEFDNSRNTKVRGALIELFASWKFDSDDVVSRLIGSLTLEVPPYVQSKAAEALGNLKAEAGLAPLVSFYFMSSDQVREYVLKSIAAYKKSDDPKVISHYQKIVAEVSLLNSTLQN